MQRKALRFLNCAFFLLALFSVNVASAQICNPCIATDPGGANGTVDIPAQCPYVNVTGTWDIIDGLPPLTQLNSNGTLSNFFISQQMPGGPLGGGMSFFDVFLELEMTGTGGLGGYSRTLMIPMNGLGNPNEMDFAPRTPGTTPQSFDTDMFRLAGQMIGDPDFDLLRITAGTGFGMPSPGHTTLTKQGGTNDWEVESFFDIEYRIDFVGAPGGPLAGMSGSTTGTIRMSNAGHHFWTDGDPHKMHYPQLPDPAGWDVLGLRPMILADDWRCTGTGPVKDLHFWGSYLDDNYASVDSFNICIYSDVPAGLGNPYSHPGNLLWQRNIVDWCELAILPPTLEGWYDPATGQALANNHNRYYQYDINLRQPDWFFQNQGTIYWLCITGYLCDPTGTARWGWKSTQNHFNDDAVWLRPNAPPVCPAPDNGAGTVDLPAQCEYVNVNGTFDIIDGLAPDQVNSQGRMGQFFDVFRTPGGPLGGEVDDFKGMLMLDMQGTGMFGGYSRSMQIPVQCQTAHGPRNPCDQIQDFPSDLIQLFAQAPIGDPDFDLLRITAGAGFGMPSPGHTTLTKMPGGMSVESFFDIFYRIDFVGAPGGPFAGRSGSTTGTIRMHQGGPASVGGTWVELFEPPGFQQSMDLAFVITDGTVITGCCNLPGDADDGGDVNIGDALSIIDYIFGGPNPDPPCLDEADADGGGDVNIGDALVVIDYIFGGPQPDPICP